MKQTFAIFVLLLVQLCSLVSSDQKCRHAYSHCNLGKEGYLNVHVVPHTHDDVGWLKTPDQYFYGSSVHKQHATVQMILDTVINELLKNPERRFVYVEIAFFWRWWNQQNDQTKRSVRMLVSEGRLEFVIGAWCMNDEATPYYTDIIDQQTLGLKFIQNEFGDCARPRAAWQVDPFGHSREQASLFAQFGFDSLFLGRIDYQDKIYRTQQKTREMLWQASSNLPGDSAQLFTGILHSRYSPPGGFEFDSYSHDDPIMDDSRLDEYNVDEQVSKFISNAYDQASAYKTNHIMQTFGNDFLYSNAHVYFKNIDKLFKYVKEAQQKNGSKVNAFYSTTSCYAYALNQANVTWPVKTSADDFFPHAEHEHAYWTGYFTSRPGLKYFVRQASTYVQVVRHLVAFADLSDNQTIDSIGLLERAMGELQHHDAVSGTERIVVAYNYAKHLAIGVNSCISVLNNAISKLSSKNVNFNYCPFLNISDCSILDNANRFEAFLYNPLPRPVSVWARFPVLPTVNYVVDQGSMHSNLIPIDAETLAIPERTSRAGSTLLFRADLPALGFRTFTIERTPQISPSKKKPETKSRDNPFTVENENIQLEFDGQGNLIQIRNLQNGLKTVATQSLCFYKAMPGNCSQPQFTASGAYIFRSQTNSSECNRVTSYSVLKLDLVIEVHQIFNAWLSQTIRLYTGEQNAEFEWQVGPIDVDDGIGREVIMKFDSDLKSNGLLYTDANGREVLQRKRDYRPSWPFQQTEEVSGNYFPVNSRIFVRDEDSASSNSRQLTLVTDRSQGGSSITDGSVELMLHRRLLYDDHLGVSENLNEVGVDGKGLIVKGSVRMIFDTIDNSARLHRELAHSVSNGPLVLFYIDGSSLSQLKWSALETELPSNLHLLTLTKDFGDDDETGVLHSIVVRIEHFYEKNEDPVLSLPVNVSLVEVFEKQFSVINVQELALGANMRVEELSERLKWAAERDDLPRVSETKASASGFEYLFSPMQIRTFRIWYLPKSN